MKLFRSILFWLHLTAGVLAGIVVLIMSVTGVLLTYEKQMIAWADTRSYEAGPPAPGAARLPVETLFVRVREAKPDVTPATVTLKSDPDAPAAFALGREGNLYVHAYTGEILGTGSATGMRQFFRTMTDWHRWLAMQGDLRNTGKAITGASNLVFLFIVVSGFYLWFPRIWTWRQFKQVLFFRSGLPGKARDFNWHNVIGVWSAVPLFIVVLSATVISYPWASNLVYRAVGEQPPAPARAPRPEGSGAGRDAHGPSAIPLDGLNAAWARAERQVGDWTSISLRVPTAAAAPVVFTIDTGYAGQPQKRGTLTLNRQTSSVERWETFADLSNGRQLRSWLRFAHTGEYYGLTGQTIAGIVSAGGAVLVYTGLALALRRFVAWLRRRSGRRANATLDDQRESTAA